MAPEKEKTVLTMEEAKAIKEMPNGIYKKGIYYKNNIDFRQLYKIENSYFSVIKNFILPKYYLCR